MGTQLVQTHLQKPAHVLVPLNIWNASQAEYREYELTELKQESAQLQQPVINSEELVAEQAVHSALVRNFNLGLVNDLNLSNADSITCDEFEQEKLNQTHHLNDLKLQTSKSMPHVLSLAGENVLSFHQEEEEVPIESKKLLGNAEYARELSEAFFLSHRVSSSAATTLNAAATTIQSFVEEETGESIECVENQPLASTPRLHHRQELIKPPIAKKPKILSQALQQNAQLAGEQADSLPPMNNVLPEQLVSRQQSLGLKEKPAVVTAIKPLAMASMDNVSMENADECDSLNDSIEEAQLNMREERLELKEASPAADIKDIQRLAMANYLAIDLLIDQASVYDNRFDQIEINKLNVSEEIHLSNLEADCDSPEQICDASLHKADEFLETVKPMDTVEIDFQERLSLMSTQNFIGYETENNNVNLATIIRFNRPAAQNDFVSSEKCSEFDSLGLSCSPIELTVKEEAEQLAQVESVRINTVQLAMGKFIYLYKYKSKCIYVYVSKKFNFVFQLIKIS